MNLALADIRSHVARFVATSLGIGLLFTIVLAMAGIYGGFVDDATILQRTLGADLWVVQRDSQGPFADQSRLDPSVVRRVWAVPGVTHARGFTFQVMQRTVGGHELRFALAGVDWPDEDAHELRLVGGRALRQARGELLVDRSLGIAAGSSVELAGEIYQVVGLLQNALAPGGEGLIVASIADAQHISEYVTPSARELERARRIERVRDTELGTFVPVLERMRADPAWAPPVLPNAPVNAVLINVSDAVEEARVHSSLMTWSDVSVLTAREQERVLLDGIVDKPKRQLALFSVILVLTSSVLIAALIYNTTLDKTHDIAMLRLLGAPSSRIAGMVLQQAWLMGILGFSLAVVVGQLAFPHFPRRIVLTPSVTGAVGLLVLLVSTLAALFAVRYALRLDAAQAMEA